MKKRLSCSFFAMVICAIILANMAVSTRAVPPLDAHKVVDIANGYLGATQWNNLCLAFVRQCFKDAYGFSSTACCAYNYGSSHIDNTSRNDIPLGADVFFGGSDITCSSCGNKCGHIGIHIGNGYIIHSWGGKVVKMKIDEVVRCGYPYRGYGWHGNQELSTNYLSRCTKYPTHLTIKITNETAIMSLPCPMATNAASQGIRGTIPGEQLTVTALYKNTTGNLWYQVDMDGTTGYVFSIDAEVSEFLSDVSISNIATPSSLKEGDRFSIQGNISASNVQIQSVSGYIYDSSRNVRYSKTVDISDNHYTLLNSPIDYAMKFNELEPGFYTYTIEVTYNTFYAVNRTELGGHAVGMTLVEQPFWVHGEGGCTNHSFGRYQSVSDTEHERVCTLCGAGEYSSHSWDSGAVTKEPSCAEEGERTYTCIDCGDCKVEPIDKTPHYGATSVYETEEFHRWHCGVCGLESLREHRWLNEKVTKEPTCTEDGELTYTCIYCSGNRHEVIPAAGTHIYDNECDSTCNTCGISRDAYHSYSSGKVIKEVTCQADGETEYTCSKCGYVQIEFTPKLDHHTYSPTITKEPSCKEEGIRTLTCTGCGDTHTETISKLYTHTWDNGTQNSDGTVTYKCTVCGKTKVEGTPTEAPTIAAPTTQPSPVATQAPTATNTPVVTQPPTTTPVPVVTQPTTTTLTPVMTQPSTAVPAPSEAPTTLPAETDPSTEPMGTTAPEQTTLPEQTTPPEQTTAPTQAADPTGPAETPKSPNPAAPVVIAVSSVAIVGGGAAYLWFFQQEWVRKMLALLLKK